jgi:uncharacterized protein (DUF952 family)
VNEGVIYHILPRADWQAAQAVGAYEPPSLVTEGFVHASTLAQLTASAQRYFAGRDDLLVLSIDTSALTSDVRYEDLNGNGAHPHIYGPVPLDCVSRVLPLTRRADGVFALPPELAPRRDPLGQAQQLTEETAQRLVGILESSAPVRHLRGSQLASGFLGAVGFALFIVGVERAAEDLPLISNAYGSIAVGLVLLLATGLLLRKLAGGD